MLRLAWKTCGLLVRVGTALVMSIALIINPVFDDIVSLYSRPALVRDELVVALPPQLTGRIQGPPSVESPVRADATSVELPFLYAGEPQKVRAKITERDLGYDVDIGLVWAGSEYEQSRRVKSFVTQYSESPMIASMAKGLRRIRKREGLDRREYAEMIVALVQSIPYGSPAGATARAPVRVVLDNRGDCDEKAILGAALLLHEGFPTAIFEFATEQHAGLGITSEYGEAFPGTDYAYIETTESLPVGEWSTLIAPDGSEVELESEPLVIPIDELQTDEP